MVTEAEVVTVLVFTVKVAVVAPAGTITLDGTVATLASLLERDTTASPLGAGPLSITVPVEEFPPVTLERSEEHTSELQSRLHLVCRLLLEKKKNKKCAT